VNRSFLLREWGAVTFVLTVFLGLIIVPIALVVGNHPAPPAGLVTTPTPTVSASATTSPTASPTASPSPTP
jgi:hypothetical protein